MNASGKAQYCGATPAGYSRRMFPRSGASRLLVVDDEPNNGAAMARRLTQQGYIVEVAGDGPQALEKIPDGRYDLVLLDQMMPGMSGLDVLRRVRSRYSQSELPVIMVTGNDQRKTVVEALRLGANDYVVKPVDTHVMSARIQSQLARSEADRAIRASDPVTGLGTRQLLLDRATEALARRNSKSEPLAIMLLDVDDFRAIVDSFGVAGENQILQQIAERINAANQHCSITPDQCTLARMGTQFAVLFDRVEALRREQMVDYLLSSFARPVKFEGPYDEMLEFEISGSAGLAGDDGLQRMAEELLRDAGLAANHGREAGKNRWRRFDTGMRERAQARISIASDLHHAIARSELIAAYQPEVDLVTREIVGFECLLRWQRSGLGCVMPSEFIPAAEQTNLIISIGVWVVDQACRQLKAWQEQFPRDKPLMMNVNLSVKQLADPDLIHCVQRSLMETGIPPETLSFELTESALITDIDSARDTLARLRSLGVGLKLDDFGTGYSSLSYLRLLQFDSLKIDRSFMSKVASDPETNAIVATIVHLAHALNMSVVAEGIEDAEQVAEAVRLGCDTAQGFYFAPGLESDAAERLLLESLSKAEAAAPV